MPKVKQQRGTAAVELAVCLPVMVILVLGAIECATMTFVKQSLHIVAYETARSAISPTAKNSEVQSRMNAMIAERKLVGADVQISPADIELINSGTHISVTVTAPTAENSVFPLQFFSGDLEAVTVMSKE